MIFGPNMQNFADIARNFVAQNAAIQVQDPESLGNHNRRIARRRKRRAELGRNALKVVHENLGAIDRTMEMILERLQNREIYIVYDI